MRGRYQDPNFIGQEISQISPMGNISFGCRKQQRWSATSLSYRRNEAERGQQRTLVAQPLPLPLGKGALLAPRSQACLETTEPTRQREASEARRTEMTAPKSPRLAEAEVGLKPRDAAGAWGWSERRGEALGAAHRWW